MKRGILGTLLALVVVACGSGSPQLFTVSGTVTGLHGTLVLLLNSDPNNAQTLTADGPFSFPNGVATGNNYVVSVSQEPAGITCLVSPNGAGVMGNADVTNVTVSCGPTFGAYNLGGTVTGIGSDGLHPVSLTNGGETIQVTADGNFVFPTQVAGGSNYDVTVVASQGYSCVVTNGSGKVNTTDITNVQVQCLSSTTAPLYLISVTVNGLTAGTAYVNNNVGGDANNPLVFSASQKGPFSFAHRYTYQEAFSLALSSSNNETCTFDSTSTTSVSGTISADAAFSVTCKPPSNYTISVSVAGLTTGTAQVDNGQTGDANNPLHFSSSLTGPYSFKFQYSQNASYYLTLTSSRDEVCTWDTGSNYHGIVSSNLSLSATCTAAPTYRISVSATGLTSGNANVTNNINGDANNPIIFTSLGASATAFSHAYLAGDHYAVDLSSSADETCYFTGGGGLTRNGNITNNVSLQVQCAPTPFFIRVLAENVLDTNSIAVADNFNTIVVSNAVGDSNTLPHNYYAGDAYSVSFAVTGSQNCYFQNANTVAPVSGTIGAADVDLVIVCEPYVLSVYAPTVGNGNTVTAQDGFTNDNLALVPAQNLQAFAHAFALNENYTVSFTSDQNCYFDTASGPSQSPATSGNITGTFGVSANQQLSIQCQ